MVTRSRHLLRAVLVAATLGLVAAPASEATPTMYWGANVGDHLTGVSAPYDMKAADAFEGMVGKQMSLIEFSLPWSHCYQQPCTSVPFPTTQMEAIRRNGSIPVFGWASYSQPLSETQPDFRLSRITSGAFDDFIRQWARDARDWGHPFFLNFDWEMNLSSLWTYSEEVNGNKPGDYVQMWRHVHDIFRDEGASNVTWTWCPNTAYDEASSQLAGLYPGDDYVDWTCVNGYNWPWNWIPFDYVLGTTYDIVQAIAPTKPMLMGETATTDKNGWKAPWITDMLETKIPDGHFPNLKGFVWFEKKEAGFSPESPSDWQVESSPASLAAFTHGIGSSIYAGADYGALEQSPIPPLTPVVLPQTPVNPDNGPAPDRPCRTAAQRRSSACQRGAVVRKLKLRPRIQRLLLPTLPTAGKNASVSFQLTDDARLTLRFSRRTNGRYRTVPGSVSFPMTKGPRTIAFSGRLANGRVLKVGRYVVHISALDSAGRRAKPVSAPFVLQAPSRR